MCYFVVTALPNQVDQGSMSKVFDKYGKKLAAAEMAIDGPSIPCDRDLFYTCKGPCDCDTPIGSRSHTRAQRGPSDRDLDKLRKKGWSKAKIDRWIEAKKNNLKEKERKRTQDDKSSALGIEEWAKLIREAVITKGCQRMGIVLLWSPGLRNHHPYQLAVDD